MSTTPVVTMSLTDFMKALSEARREGTEDVNRIRKECSEEKEKFCYKVIEMLTEKQQQPMSSGSKRKASTVPALGCGQLSSPSYSSILSSSPSSNAGTTPFVRSAMAPSSAMARSSGRNETDSQELQRKHCEKVVRNLFIRMLLASVSFHYHATSFINFKSSYVWKKYFPEDEDETTASRRFVHEYFFDPIQYDDTMRSHIDFIRDSTCTRVEAMVDLMSAVLSFPSAEQLKAAKTTESDIELYLTPGRSLRELKEVFAAEGPFIEEIPPCDKEDGLNRSLVLYSRDLYQSMKVVCDLSSSLNSKYKPSSRVTKPLLENVLKYLFSDYANCSNAADFSVFLKSTHLAPNVLASWKLFSSGNPGEHKRFDGKIVFPELLGLPVVEPIFTYWDEFFSQDREITSSNNMPLIPGNRDPSTDGITIISIELETYQIEEEDTDENSSETRLRECDGLEVCIRVESAYAEQKSAIIPNLRPTPCTAKLVFLPNSSDSTFTCDFQTQDEDFTFFRVYDRKLFQVTEKEGCRKATDIYAALQRNKCPTFPDVSSYILSGNWLTSFDLWMKYLNNKVQEFATPTSNDEQAEIHHQARLVLASNLLVVVHKWRDFVSAMNQADDSDDMAPLTFQMEEVIQLMSSFGTFGIPNLPQEDAILNDLPSTPKQAFILKAFEQLQQRIADSSEDCDYHKFKDYTLSYKYTDDPLFAVTLSSDSLGHVPIVKGLAFVPLEFVTSRHISLIEKLGKIEDCLQAFVADCEEAIPSEPVQKKRKVSTQDDEEE